MLGAGTSRKIVIKYLQSGKFQACLWVWPNKVSFTTVVLIVIKLQKWFPKYFCFHPLVLTGSFQNNNLKVTRVIFTSYILLYSLVHYYTDFNKRLWNHGGSETWEKPWSSNAKIEPWLMPLTGRPSTVGNMHFFVPCQIDVVNNQFFLYLASWNNPLSKVTVN